MNKLIIRKLTTDSSTTATIIIHNAVPAMMRSVFNQSVSKTIARPYLLRSAALFANPALAPGSVLRTYHSYEHLNSDDRLRSQQHGLKEQILSVSINEAIKNYGFTANSIDYSINKVKHATEFANKSTNLKVLFNNSNSKNNNEVEELVDYYLQQSRLSLQEAIKTDEYAALPSSSPASESQRIKYLIAKRLQYNITHLSNNVHDNRQLQNNLRVLLSHLVQPSKVASSTTHLYELVDDVLFYAGDKSHEFDWYEKRLKIAAIFVKCELFMLTDQSLGFNKTFKFLDEQIGLYDSVNGVVASVQEWLIFNGFSLINLIKSQLARG